MVQQAQTPTLPMTQRPHGYRAVQAALFAPMAPPQPLIRLEVEAAAQDAAQDVDEWLADVARISESETEELITASTADGPSTPPSPSTPAHLQPQAHIHAHTHAHPHPHAHTHGPLPRISDLPPPPLLQRARGIGGGGVKVGAIESVWASLFNDRDDYGPVPLDRMCEP